jgi:hypothetical protein
MSSAPQSVSLGGWEDVEEEVSRRRVTMLIYGDTGTGRTKLALTAPGPIALAHTAEKIDGVVQLAQQEKKAAKLNPTIKVVNFGVVASGTNQQIADTVGPVWSRMTQLWYDAVDNWATTAICDTDTEAWELCRLAFFGELNPKGRIDNLYGPVNARWRAIFKRNKKAQPVRCNIIAISQTKDEYKDVMKGGQKVSEKTGRTIRVGQREIPIAADIIVRTSKYFDRQRGQVFTATIEKGWYNAAAEGITLEDDDCRFTNILQMITGYPEEEWL